MPKVEIMLQAPDAEALAQEVVKEAGADSGASVQRLPTRGVFPFTIYRPRVRDVARGGPRRTSFKFLLADVPGSRLVGG